MTAANPIRKIKSAYVSQYGIDRQKIANALRGIMVLPKNRSLRRYTHGWTSPARTEYFIGYTWMRPRAHHMTGCVYDVTIARGKDFDDALAKAVARMQKKREQQEDQP